MANVSNEAEELHRMCLVFKDLNGGHRTLEVLAALFGSQPEEAEYYIFLSAIRLRFQRFLKAVDEAVLNERHRTNLRNAVRHLMMFTEIRYATNGWPNTKAEVFTDTHLMALDMAGGGLAGVVPVVVLSEDERTQYVADLRQVYDEISETHDFASEMVGNAILASIRMIELFDIFGSIAIGEKLIQLHATAKQAAELVPKERRAKYTKAAGAVAIVLGGLVYADGVVSAVENFYTRAGTIAEQLLLANPPQLKLLPSPKISQDSNGHPDAEVTSIDV
ncbi:hypothetical protein FHT87_004611 [Rhizobium sp. BK316]|uniref:hypothetical protein n=1 Tax=Rhizobium sp. BK316 TaxID=2587053 RepID=UPI00160FA751|nr:hypothetical protein [Rhizobium sp. BK316]MBB3410679.1 hypothetical protein [Rhizobium sp. BK316]